MFDLSFTEIFLVVVAAVIFIGPKEMPAVIRGVAKAMRAMRGLTREIKKTFDELAKESGLKDEMAVFDHEMKMIQGDDGNWYEAYQPKTPMPPSDKKDAPDE